MATTKMLSLCSLAILLLPPSALAATVTYDFNITWLTRNPDGQFDRPTIGINGQWPLPPIVADVGDTIVVNVLNQLGDESTSLHFHGLYMNNYTTHMDGPVGVSQCPIPPGSRFTYNFTVDQPGTYWYHSHAHAQYPDGLRGPLIIHDKNSPYRGKYDEEVVLTVSDWYHGRMRDLLPAFLTKANPTGAEPVPDAALLNDTQDLKVPVRPGKTYLFRMANVGAFAGQYVWFEGHNITVVEVDGVYTQPAEASMIYLSAAQRCSFLLTTRNETGTNFPFVSSMDTSLFDSVPADLNYNVTGWLVYDDAKDTPKPAALDEFNPIDDVTFVPYDNMTRLGEPDQTITLKVIMANLRDGANYAFFNNITYKAPKVPTLYTALTSGDLATDPRVYGGYTNSFVLERGQVVQVVVNNADKGRHPFHLHGHNFQVLHRSAEAAGTYEDESAAAGGDSALPAIPMRRDTVLVQPGGNAVLRFRADNPGVWLFHCHIEWHLSSGLVATFVEAPLDLQRNLTVPPGHLDVCAAAGMPATGNAAGRTAPQLLDLSGENAPPPALPDGFETRGIVALVFSCICGVLGVAVVAWYGLADVGSGASNQSTGSASPVPGEADGDAGGCRGKGGADLFGKDPPATTTAVDAAVEGKKEC